MMRSLLVWLFTWLFMIAAGVVALPWLWITGRLELAYGLARVGVRGLLWLAGVEVVVVGRELLPADGPRLYMANHQSNLDPPILIAYLPGNIAFLAKQELFSVPVLGWVLKAGDLVPVERGNRAAAQRNIARAAEAARGGRPFLVFPEGTRSPDGRLLEFKKGVFYLAEEAGVPVVPITLAGTGARMPRGALRIRPGKVEVRIHAPLPPEAWAGAAEPRGECARLVREAMRE
ncbi:MAG TPA: lysophospholipid acyltransferase family protein [Terriglobales bacterium]|nr:lysophospholipid acyltransferase family protein [Terriglobales bacterium]